MLAAFALHCASIAVQCSSNSCCVLCGWSNLLLFGWLLHQLQRVLAKTCTSNLPASTSFRPPTPRLIKPAEQDCSKPRLQVLIMRSGMQHAVALAVVDMWSCVCSTCHMLK